MEVIITNNDNEISLTFEDHTEFKAFTTNIVRCLDGRSSFISYKTQEEEMLILGEYFLKNSCIKINKSNAKPT